MKPETLIKEYGSLSKAALMLGYSKQRLFNWKKLGRIPDREQIRIHKLTDGKLKADKKIIAEFSIQ